MASNPFLEFHDDVKSNPRKYSKEIKQIVAIQKDMLKKYDFIEEKGKHVVDWIERFAILVEGERAGEKVKLLLWNKWFIYSIFCFYGYFEEEEIDVNGNVIGKKKKYLRVVNDILKVIATGNAKTTLMAWINMYLLYSSDFPSARIYIGSNAKEQSKLCFNTTTKIIEKNKALFKWARIVNSMNMAEIKKKGNDLSSYIYAMSSDGKNYEGIIPTNIMIDEIHEMKDNKYASNLRKSVKRDDAFVFESTTEGTVRGGYLDERLEYAKRVLDGEIVNHRFFPVIFKQDSESEIVEAYMKNDVELLMKSNPSLGYAISITLLKGKIKEMIDDPSKRVTVLTKNFNLPQNPESNFYSKEECQTLPFNEDVFIGAPVFFGFDMAWTRTPNSDLASLRMMLVNPFTEERYTKDFIFLPKYWSFQENDEVKKLDMIKYKSKEDMNIKYDPRNNDYGYQKYIDRGDVILIDEELVDELVSIYGEKAYCDCTGVTETFILFYIAYLERKYKFIMCKFGLDPNKASNIESYINQNMKGTDGKEVAIKFMMEHKTYSQLAMNISKDRRSRRLVYNNNKLTELHFNSAHTKETSSGIKLVNQQRARKDAVISELACESAYNVFINNKLSGAYNLNLLREWWKVNEVRLNEILAKSSL